MSESWYIIWVLLTLTRGYPVSPKNPIVEVEGFVEEPMVLPFRYNGNISEVIAVHWRCNDKLVYDIDCNGTETVGPEYKERVASFPSEYKNGNYSILIKNLQKTDAGKCLIFITGSQDSATIKLSVKERPGNDLSAALFVAGIILAFGFSLIVLLPVCTLLSSIRRY